MPEEWGASSPMAGQDKQKMTLVKDAYYRYTDVIFNWHKALSPAHAQAVTTLFNATALVQPDHPLHVEGENGITLFVGYDKINKPRLLFSLKQVQYIQYYIHEMRLTTSSWTKYCDARAALLAEGEEGEAEAAKLETPSLEEGADDWVPLPDAVCIWSDFVEIQPITIPTAAAMMKIYKQCQKDAKTAERHERSGFSPPKWDLKRFEAIIDNMTPGPGLRKGPMKVHEGRKRGGAVEDEIEGVGWGGFPLPTKNMETESGQAADLAVTQGEDVTFTTTDKASELKFASNEGDMSDAVRKDDNTAESDSPSHNPSTESPSSEDYGMRYHFHCQQALIYATEGGYVNAYATANPAEDKEENAQSELPKAVGRSLFVALSATTWEKDPKVVLEVGWSAVFWQERLDAEKQKGNSRFEEMRDFGHYTIQDHLSTKKNGEQKPDHRDQYLFGDSLPIVQDKLKDTVRQKLKELSKRAGQGPIYIIAHAPEGDEIDLKDIGLDASSWAVDLQPDSWKVPPYVCTRGCESVFMINTAALFGAIEGATAKEEGRTMIQQVGRTTKSLQHTALVMFGQDPTRRPEKCGNAGNDAFYTLEVFLAIMTGPPLPELREDYRQSLIKRSPSIVPNSEDRSHDEGKSTIDVVHTVPLTPDKNEITEKPKHDTSSVQLPSGGEMREVGNDESGDSDDDDDDGYVDDEDIKGVYYKDEDGNLVEMMSD